MTDLRPGVWVVDGFAQRPYAYLLQWDEEIVAPGSCFVARGVLHEGGLQIGFFENKRWASQITISRPGPFTAVFTFPRSGRYALVLANYVESSLLERIRRYPLQGLLGLLGHGMFPNHFRVDQAGWVRPDAVGAT